jgi:hypothetical protein
MRIYTVVKRMFFLIVIAVSSVSCIRPALIIPDNLEIKLRDKKSYHHYVKLVNRAMAKDTIALRELLMMNDIGDAASYEHGDILIQLLENLGDEHYSKVLSSIPTKQKEVFLQSYFEAGMDIRKSEYKIQIDKEYPITFNELEFDEKRRRIFISSCVCADRLN